MREILFKAKTLSDNKWVEGHLCYDSADKPSIVVKNKDNTGLLVYRVHKKTICEYSGIMDNNNQKIFENDNYIVLGFEDGTKYCISFHNGAFCGGINSKLGSVSPIGWEKDDDTSNLDLVIDEDFCKTISIIGNVFDDYLNNEE